MAVKLRQIDPYLWEIPREGRMKVPGRVYLAPEQIADVNEQQALEQVRNVAHLPGILGYSLAMPDIHWGYGFPIGGVAAVDDRDGAVSPGGVGYDVNCLAGETRVLFPDGYSRPIRDIVEAGRSEAVSLLDLRRKALGRADVVGVLSRTPARRVWEITTATGHRLVGTEDHPVLTPEGMQALGTLEAGRRIAVFPFEGVPWEAPGEDLILDEDALLAEAAARGTRLDPASLERILEPLRSLLPLGFDHRALPALLRLLGWVYGCGRVSFDEGRLRGRTIVYGPAASLGRMARELGPLLGASRVQAARGGGDARLTLGGTGLALLLAHLGAPSVREGARGGVPAFLFQAPRWQQRLFLASFLASVTRGPLGTADLEGHRPLVTRIARPDAIRATVRLLRELARLLEGFGVRALIVTDRPEPKRRTTRLRLLVSDPQDDLVALWSRVGYEYAHPVSASSCLAAAWLKRRRALGVAICQSAPRGHLPDAAEPECDPSDLLPSFETWSARIGEGLEGSGVVWEEIVARRPRKDVERVYDLTVDHPDHNFVAGGVVVHNCGVRVLTTGLSADDVRPVLKPLIRRLYQAVPTGVGSSAAIPKLGSGELRRVLAEGAAWAFKRGYRAGDDDLSHCEEGGQLPGADPQAPSPRALERGSAQLGTLGSGNHFLEVQRVAEIYDEAAAEAFGLRLGALALMIHSGSRGLGHQVADETIHALVRRLDSYGEDYAALPDRQLACAPIRSDAGQRYLGAMQAAANFAWANRQVMTGLSVRALAAALGVSEDRLGARLLFDVCHNIAKFEEHLVDGVPRRVLVHRKGATRAFGPGDPRVPERYRAVGQPVLIPGDMGRYSFVLAGNAAAMTRTFGSSCHGAGRVLSRTAARKQAAGRHIDAELRARGIEVMARALKTLSEEMSEAYKDVATVVDVIHGAGLSRKVARLEPMGVIKG